MVSSFLGRRVAMQSNMGVPLLNSTQLGMDQMIRGFAEGASDWKALLSLTLGASAFRLSKFATMSVVSSPYLGTVLGFLAEVSTIRSSEALLHGKNIEEAFEAKAFASSALYLGVLKSSGSLVKNQNLIFTHALQSGAMLGAAELGAKLKLTDSESGSFAQKWIKAEMINIQMLAGASLAYGALPGLTMREKALDVLIQTPVVVKKNSGTMLGTNNALPVMSSQREIFTEQKVHIPGGTYVRGSRVEGSYARETPHFVKVSPFRISATAVSNAQLMEYWDIYHSRPFAIIGRDEAGIWRVVERGKKKALQDWMQEHSSAVPLEGLRQGNYVFDRGTFYLSRVVPERPEHAKSERVSANPAGGIHWAKAVSIADALGGRLPTEAEWELAARGRIVDVTAQMREEGVALEKFADFAKGPLIQGKYFEGHGGRYENFVPVDPVTLQIIGTQIFTNPKDPKLAELLKSGQSIGAWRVFPTETGVFEGDVIWSSVHHPKKHLRPVSEGRLGPSGLLDMGGNLREWTNDAYAHYPSAAENLFPNPTGPKNGPMRVYRGGSFDDSFPAKLRAASRGFDLGGVEDPLVGLRAVFPVE